MPARGLSLVGFMEHLPAIAHLRFACVPGDPSDAALTREWQNATARLQNTRIPNAGNPTKHAIPGSDQSYVQQFIQQPWVATALQPIQGTYQFLLMEIDPLLSFQLVVNLERVDQHFRSLPRTVGTSDLLPVCLPLTQPVEEHYISPILIDSKSVIIKSRNTGLTSTVHGIFPFQINGYQTRLAGIRFDFNLPFVHVVEFNGRCYLHNGFHRAVGARRAGATHVPCIFRRVSDYDAVGVKNDGTTFTTRELDSAAPPNPPTVGHFTQGAGWDVRLRNVSKILHVSWSEYTAPDE